MRSISAPHDFTWENDAAPASASSVSFAAIRQHPLLPLSLRRERYEKGKTTGEHRHLNFFALYLVRSGHGVHRIDGHPYGLARGDVYLMPPGAVHAYENWENLEVDGFYFPLTLWDEQEIAALRALPGFWGLFVASNPHLHLSPEHWRPVEESVAQLRDEYIRLTPEAPLLLKGGVFRLLVQLSRIAPARSHLALSTRPRELAALLEWCETHCDQPLSVPQLAAMMFLSPGHFSELFTREVGQSPAAYVRHLRLEKARILLRESSLSATQIALQTGFGDAAHFSRAFKALYGVSPRQCRGQN